MTPADPRHHAGHSDPRWRVVYDDDCGFCRALLGIVLHADDDRLLRPVALSSPEAHALLADLTQEQRQASWHLVAPDGDRTSAGAALAPLLRLLPHGSAAAAALDRIPGATECAYTWVAEHRTGLSRFMPSEAKRRGTRLIARRSQ